MIFKKNWHDFMNVFQKFRVDPYKLINKMLSKKVYGPSNTLIHGFCLPFGAKQAAP